MFASLFANTPEIGAVKTTEECDAVLGKPFVVLFKHSRSCSLSSSAKSEVGAYKEAHPETPIFIVFAQQQALSHYVADKTGVPHASPQIIVMRNGRVVASASHHAISFDALSELTQI